MGGGGGGGNWGALKGVGASKRGKRGRGPSVVSCRPDVRSKTWFSIPWGVPKILIAIGNACLNHFHPHIVPPIVTQLTRPLKVCGVRNIGIHQLLHHISSMHVQGDEGAQCQAVLSRRATGPCQFRCLAAAVFTAKYRCPCTGSNSGVCIYSMMMTVYLHSQLPSDKISQVQQVVDTFLQDGWDAACPNTFLHHLKSQQRCTSLRQTQHVIKYSLHRRGYKMGIIDPFQICGGVKQNIVQLLGKAQWRGV